MLWPVDQKSFIANKNIVCACGQIMQYKGLEPFLGDPGFPVVKCRDCDFTLHLIDEEKAKQWGIDNPVAYREKHLKFDYPAGNLLPKENGKMKFYKTEKTAYRAALKRGEVGLKGSGQTCQPVYIEGYGWAYKTWDNRYLIPGGELDFEWLENNYQSILF